MIFDGLTKITVIDICENEGEELLIYPSNAGDGRSG
jgi:hypothetical protein